MAPTWPRIAGVTATIFVAIVALLIALRGPEADAVPSTPTDTTEPAPMTAPDPYSVPRDGGSPPRNGRRRGPREFGPPAGEPGLPPPGAGRSEQPGGEAPQAPVPDSESGTPQPS